MNDTKLIIFDFDGTLGDTRRTIVATMQMTIAEMVLPERNEAECASTIGLPLAGCFEALFPNLKPEQVQRCAETYRRIFYENVQTIKPQAFPQIGADDVEKAKPNAEPVLNTLAAMKFEASEALVVGDMAVDIQMGVNAGAKTCGVTWGNGSREELQQAGADVIIDRIEELTGLLSFAPQT